jgi:hypothetical protein
MQAMARKQRKTSNKERARPAARQKRKKLRWGILVRQLGEVERLTDRINDIVQDKFAQRVIELEAALDFYAWGPGPKGELEPMEGEEYAEAIAKDGGRIARTYLQGRFDGAYYGARNKKAPAGWGIRPAGEST